MLRENEEIQLSTMIKLREPIRAKLKKNIMSL